MNVIYALQSAASPALDSLMLWITRLGSEQVYIVLLILAFVVVDAAKGRSLALVFLASFYLNQVLKELFATQRPFLIDETVARSQAAIDSAPGNGFPSGHAQSSMTFWGLAAVYVGRRWFIVLAALVVLAVSLSRLYLGVHLPIDVIGGLLLGLLAVAVGVAVERLELKPTRPLKLVLGLVLPLLVHLLFPLENSGLLLGALAAFVVGPELAPHDTSGPLSGRLVLGVLAVALAFGTLAASSALLPEEVKRSALGSFTRYFLLALTGTALVPWFGRATGLTPRREAGSLAPSAKPGA
ncbi:MAG TPA: phosphatase PAP2 family protein [Trueperaceae bacterium]|nr:phosphatase PAP2 family protein [Trueperaceae bacterium]